MTRPSASAANRAVPTAARGTEQQLFTTVSVARASAAIVEQIKALIRDGRLAPSDRLPSERELCAQFGVSRVTVREALRILETSGLITVKVGAKGGNFVATPTSDQVGAGLADLVTLSPLTAGEVTEARFVFELGIIPLVVERATERDLEELRRITAEHAQMLKQGAYTMEMSVDFHVAVAACAHNNAVTMLVQSLHGPLLMSLLTARTVEPLMGRRGAAEHVALIDAIEARDVGKAQDIMRTHLRRTAKRVAKANAIDG